MSEEKKDNQWSDNQELVSQDGVVVEIGADKAGENPSASGDKKETVASSVNGHQFTGRKGGGEKRGLRRGKRGGRERTDRGEEFDQRVLDVARVTRVMAGGKRMSFRTCVAIGDKKGKVGLGLGKGADVAIAVNKAINKAKKSMVEVFMIKETIPHEVYCKVGAAKILFKPARKGRGVIAGGVVRSILELAGVSNVSAKVLGTNNKINNAKCTLEALKRLRKIEIKKVDGKTDNEKKSEAEIKNA